MGGTRGKLTSSSERQEALRLIDEARDGGARLHKACEILGISVRTYQRWRDDLIDRRRHSSKKTTNKLSKEERAKVISISNSKEFVDLPPKQIVPRLADEGEYVASESTFYRILKEENMNAYRGKSKRKTAEKPQEYVADKPNYLWCWDITYLASSIKGLFFYLYFIMDVFSRKIVGFEVFAEESAENASKIIAKSYMSENISGKVLILHSDNGSPMKGATMLGMLQNLGVVPSFSRPSVSNDNAFSEALFKTLKYCPQYPDKPFETLDEAKAWVKDFVSWYNCEHKHSAIKFVTPNERHSGLDLEILENRKAVYEAAKLKNPSRWSGSIRNWDYISSISLNPKTKKIKPS